MERRIRALSGTVIVALGDFERTTAGIQIVPGSVLAYGREVYPPWGVVIASGDPEYLPGQRVVVQNDEGAPTWQGMRIVCLHTQRVRHESMTAELARARHRAGKRRAPPEEIAAVMLDEHTYEARGTRVVLELLSDEPESTTLQVVRHERGAVDRGEVASVAGGASSVQYGDTLLVRHDVGVRWSLGGRSYCSVREAELLAVEDWLSLDGEPWAVADTEVPE